MNTTNYRAFNVTVEINGVYKFFRGLVAADLNAALADIEAAYGTFNLVQWGMS